MSDRSRFLRRAAITAGVALVVTSLATTVGQREAPADAEADGAAEPARRDRNIVMIMVDDMRDDDLRYMPWTRRLVSAQGVRFRNSFSPYPWCCPARSSVFTGRYTHNHRVFGIRPPYGFTSFRDTSSIATWLRRAGYATILVGKYLNGYGWMPRPGSTSGNSLGYVPPGWTSWRASIDGGLPAKNRLAGSTYRYFDTTLSLGGRGFVNYAGRYQTQVYGELTERIITKRARADQPFFLYVSYTAPHEGRPAEPDDPRPITRSDGKTIRLGTPARPRGVEGLFDRIITEAPGASWRDPDFSDKPEYLRREPRLSPAEWRGMAEVARQRAEALWVVDRQVKRTVDALAASGELASTLILFTSDNGYYLGEQRRRQGKIFPHEPSLRVPLLVRGPGIPAGQVRRDPAASIDLAPTLADFAGVVPSTPVDGESLLAVARKGDRGWTRPVLTEVGPMFGVRRDTNEAGRSLAEGGRADIRFAVGVRTSRYLYVDLATGEKELYDLVSDPREYENLAGDPAYAETQRLLARVLHRVRACDGPDCRAPLPAPLRTTGRR